MKNLRCHSLLKFVLPLMTLVVSISAFASLQCSQLFSTTVSSEVLDIKIEQLARLRIHVDQLQITRDDSPEFSVLKGEYERLVQALLEKAGITETEFKDRIKAAIDSHQKTSLKEDTKEIEARQSQSEVLMKKPSYTKEEEFSLDFAKDWKFASAKISDAEDIVFVTPKRDLVAFDLRTKQEKTLLHLQTANAQFMPDGIHVGVLAFDRHLNIYHPKTGAMVHEVMLKINNFMNRNDGRDFSKMEFSPDGKTVVFAGDNIISFDVKTGKLINADPILSAPSRLRFISNTEVLYIKGYTLIKHNLVTNEKERYQAGTNLLYDFEVYDNNTRAAIFVSDGSKEIIDLKGAMSRISREDMVRETYGSIQRMATDSNYAFIRTGNLSTLRLFDMMLDVPVFEFMDEHKDASVIFLSRDGATAGFRRQQKGKETFQIWRRQ